MTIEILSSIAGVVLSLMVALGASFFKGSRNRQITKEKESTLEDVRRRLTDISFNFLGVGVKHRIEHSPDPQIQLANELVDEIKQEIAERISEQPSLRHASIEHEIDLRLEDVRNRIKAIEARFPDNESIDKIASINDALFAERIEQLSFRIDSIEKQILTKWDVAITVSLVVAGVFAVVGATYAVLSVFGVIA